MNYFNPITTRENIKDIRNLPFVSIGFMTYNYPAWGGREHFVKALESLISQEYQNKEILILDDCSNDDIYKDCLAYAEQYPCIRIYKNDKNIGVVNNFKKLLNLIEGELFLWACPDDIYDKIFISKCVENFINDPEVVIAGSAVKIFHENSEVHIHHYHDFLRNLPSRKIARNTFRGRDSCGKNVHYPPLIHSSIMKRKLINQIFHENIFFFAEELWFLNGLAYGKMAYIDEILYFRYCGNASHQEKNPALSSKLKFHFLDTTRYLCEYIKFILLNKDIIITKKLQLLKFLIQAIRYRILIRFWSFCKCSLVDIVRKFGLMKYGLG